MATKGEYEKGKAGSMAKELGKVALDKATSKAKSKTVGFIIKIVTAVAGFLATIITPALIMIMLPTMIVTYVCNFIMNIEIYEQECPELVRAFLSSRYEEFESEIRDLCNDKDFIAFVESTEFDIAYSKMVYGGTKTYTEKELLGNYKGVQDIKSSFVTKNEDGTYEAKSIIGDILDYQKAGVPTDKIFIKDEYLSGYSSSGIESNDVAVKFDDWIKASFYTIPSYYSYANAKKEYGYEIDLEEYDNGVELSAIQLHAKQESYSNLLTSDILEFQVGYGDKHYYSFINPIGHKFDVYDNFWEKVKKWALNDDMQETGLHYEVIQPKDTDLYSWLGYKGNSEKKNNYEKYLKGLDDETLNTFGKREYEENFLIENWKDNFAEYLAKELYYIYPNRQYIMDYFLGDGEKSPSRDDKVKFLQRSFQAMASGSSLEVEFAESYSVKNGFIINNLTGNNVGSLDIEDIEYKNIKMQSFSWHNPIYKEILYCTNGHGKEMGGFVIDKGNYYIGENLEKNEDGHYYCPECKTKLNTPQWRLPIEVAMYQTEKTFTYEDFKRVCDEMAIISEKPLPDKVQYSYDIDIITKEGNTLTLDFKNGGQELITIYAGDDAEEIILNFYGKSDEMSEFISKNYTWSKEFYQNNTVATENTKEANEVAESGKKALDSMEIDVRENIIAIKGFDKKEINNYRENKLLEFLNKEAQLKPENPAEDNLNSLIALFDGEGVIKEKRDKVELNFYDASILNWKKKEKKNGDNIESVTYEIAMKYADVSQYDDNEGKYRVAYGFETKGAIKEAFSLLEYVKKTGSLENVAYAVDFDQLFVRIDDDTTTGEYLTTGTIQKIIMEIISKNESGDYGACRNPIVATEHYLTVGYMQWYGGRAYNVLKTICKDNKSKAKEILSDDLYRYITSWSYESNRNLTKDELTKIEKLLTTDRGKEIQEKQAIKDVQGYIDEIQNEGVTNPYVLAYLCDCKHQSPVGQDRVLEELKRTMPDFNERGMEALHAVNEIAKNDVYTTEKGNKAGLGVFVTRRDRTYDMLKIFDLEGVGTYAFPVDVDSEWRISSAYGNRQGGFHYGLDIAAPEKTKIYASKSGKVVYAGEGKAGSTYGNYGYCVAIDDGTYVNVYAHMYSKPKLEVGDKVEIGQLIGYVGNTGKSTGNHLHYELRINGELYNCINPADVIQFPDGFNAEPYKTKK